MLLEFSEFVGDDTSLFATSDIVFVIPKQVHGVSFEPVIVDLGPFEHDGFRGIIPWPSVSEENLQHMLHSLSELEPISWGVQKDYCLPCNVPISFLKALLVS